MTDTPESQRIAELRTALRQGDEGALEAFWRRLESEGAPLVEAVSDDEAKRLVTFVYCAEGPLQNVAVFPGIGNMGSPRDNMLQRLDETNLWYRTYKVRADLRAAYHFSLNDPMTRPLDLRFEDQDAYLAERAASWVPDPLNGIRAAFTPGQEPQSYVELADAPPQPYIEKRDGVPEGTIEREDLDGDPLGTGRRIWTYLPPGHDRASGPYPLVVQFDGIVGRKIAMHTTLDNMIAEGIIPPVICVMMHNIDRMTELACNGTFTDWIADVFLPLWRQKYALTSAPSETVVAGMSLGGLASAFFGLRRPEVFGNVLSQSGSYWWRPEDGTGGDWQWLTREFEASPRLPLRWYMDVGLLEDGMRPSQPEYPTMVEANRRLRDALIAKGYDVAYAEFNGGHDYVSWRGTIADGLKTLLGTAQR